MRPLFKRFPSTRRRGRLAKKVEKVAEVRICDHRRRFFVQAKLYKIRARRGARGLPPRLQGQRVLLLHMPAVWGGYKVWHVGTIVDASLPMPSVRLDDGEVIIVPEMALDPLAPWLADHVIMAGMLRSVPGVEPADMRRRPRAPTEAATTARPWWRMRL